MPIQEMWKGEKSRQRRWNNMLQYSSNTFSYIFMYCAPTRRIFKAVYRLWKGVNAILRLLR